MFLFLDLFSGSFQGQRAGPAGRSSEHLVPKNDVVSTSMRRHHVASTVIRHHFYVMCQLGESLKRLV